MSAGETRPANMTALRRLLDWRRVLVYTHRWLGICGGMLFVAWFVSGIVMMYAGMPSLSPAERLKRLPPLDLSSARFSPDEAAQSVGVTPGRVIVTMLGERPVYRMQTRGGGATVFADDGRRLDGLTGDDVMSVVADFAPEHVATLEYVRELSEPDQWTLQSRQFMPLHQVSLGDEADTQIYVSDRTGEPVMKTTRGGRRVAYVGAVLHWLYFTPFRRHSNLWLQTVIWLSIIGCVLCLTGLVWGVWRVSVSSRYRLRGAASHTPYAGLMRWHHYAGLIFGLTTFTWTLSGGLSLDPWNWHPPTSPTAAQRTAVAGGPFTLEGITLESLRTAVEVVATSFPPKELEVLRFRAESFLVARRATSGPGGIEHKLVSATRPAEGSFTVFDADDVFAAALAAMPGVDVEDSTLAGGLRRLLLRSTWDASLASAAGPVRRPAADVAVFGPRARGDRAEGGAADAAQPVAISRLAQPRFSVPICETALVGHRGDPAERGRHRAQRHHCQSVLAAVATARTPV